MKPPTPSVEEQGLGHGWEIHTKDRLGDERDVHMYNVEDNSYFHSVLANEDHFFTAFVECVSNSPVGNTQANNEDGPFRRVGTNMNPSKKLQKSVLKTNPVHLKRNRRQSGGSAMLAAQIKQMVDSCRIMSEGGPSRMNKEPSSTSTVALAMQIINRMVENQILEKGSDFWCYATLVLEDAVKREIFLNMDDDEDSRLKWLHYLHRMKGN